jgi:hypothetical protein
MPDNRQSQKTESGLAEEEIVELWERFKLERAQAYKEMIEFTGDPANPDDIVRAECAEGPLFWFLAALIEGGHIALPDGMLRDILSSKARADVMRHAISVEPKFLLYR